MHFGFITECHICRKDFPYNDSIYVSLNGAKHDCCRPCAIAYAAILFKISLFEAMDLINKIPNPS